MFFPYPHNGQGMAQHHSTASPPACWNIPPHCIITTPTHERTHENCHPHPHKPPLPLSFPSLFNLFLILTLLFTSSASLTVSPSRKMKDSGITWEILETRWRASYSLVAIVKTDWTVRCPQSCQSVVPQTRGLYVYTRNSQRVERGRVTRVYNVWW